MENSTSSTLRAAATADNRYPCCAYSPLCTPAFILRTRLPCGLLHPFPSDATLTRRDRHPFPHRVRVESVRRERALLALDSCPSSRTMECHVDTFSLFPRLCSRLISCTIGKKCVRVYNGILRFYIEKNYIRQLKSNQLRT